MANFVDNSVTEVGSSSGAERMTRSRARRNREERAARCEANTLARKTARGRQSQGERTATREVDTLARETTRGRQSQGERTATREVDTLVRETARASQSQGERAATREADTLARRTARARQSQGERADIRDANNLRMMTARARQSQQQASTPEWSRLPVLNRPNPAAINLGHEHQCSHCNARLLLEENESFCCREGRVAITPLRPLPEGWEEMFRMPTFRYGSLCMSTSTILAFWTYI